MYYRPMLVIALAGFAGSVQAAEIKIPPNMPTPSPGLWETQITMPTMGGMSMSADNCVGGIEEMLRHPELDTSDCDDIIVQYEGGRATSTTTCRIDQSTARISSTFTGDLEKNYQGTIHTVFTPPLQGMGETMIEVSSRWVTTQCLPGQKPGDAKMKGGVTIPGVGNIDLDALMKNIPGRQ